MESITIETLKNAMERVIERIEEDRLFGGPSAENPRLSYLVAMDKYLCALTCDGADEETALDAAFEELDRSHRSL